MKERQVPERSVFYQAAQIVRTIRGGVLHNTMCILEEQTIGFRAQFAPNGAVVDVNGNISAEGKVIQYLGNKALLTHNEKLGTYILIPNHSGEQTKIFEYLED